jgi:tRNAThr (cytosine32-N3)-methyltransferase
MEDSDEKFKGRLLKNEADVWSYNSWDHVPPPNDQNDIVAAALAKQHSSPVLSEDKVKYNTRPSRNWWVS